MENTMTNQESNQTGENTMTRAIDQVSGTMTQPTKEAKMTKTNTETKMKNKVTVSGVVESEGKLTVIGVCDDIPFESTPTRWGSKMLMKVTSPGDFTQGQKIAIGHASKKALKAAEKALPEAVLVRPRKAKVEAEAQVSEAPEAEVVPEA